MKGLPLRLGLMMFLLATTAVALAKAPKPAVVVGAFSPEEGSVLLLGGRLGDAWIGSEQARGLLRQGDRMTLYGLTEGKLGEVVLAGRGRRLSQEKKGPAVASGVEFPARLHLTAGREGAYRRARAYAKAVGAHTYSGLGNCLLVIWSRGRPAPKWVPVRALSQDIARPAIVAFLAAQQQSKGLNTSSESRKHAVITQAVALDLDGDGAAEQFLSFHHAGSQLLFSEKPRANEFHYFLSQTPRPRARVTVIQDRVPMCALLGALDLNGDGIAELLLHRCWPDNDFGDIAERTPSGSFRYHPGWWFSN